MSFLWGNTANQQPDQKKFANISNDQINSNQQAQPIKYLAGRNYVAGDYITPAYNPKAVAIKSKTGKTESSTTGYKYFADFALVFCTGGRRPVDAIYKVIVDSDIRWDGEKDGNHGVQRGNAQKEVIQVEDLGTIHLYWGSETQGIDGVLLSPRNATATDKQDKTTFNANHQSDTLQFDGRDAGDPDPYSGHYDKHPAYRGQCYAVFKKWKLGRDRTSIPNIQFELKRGCTWHSGGFVAADDRGVNPIAVLFEWLTEPRFGMALPESLLNLATFNTAYNALEAVQARISPLITSQSDFRGAIADLMGYFDGWIRRNGTKIEVGIWAHGNVPAGPTLLDDDLLGEPELEPQGFGPTFNELTVTYKDRQHHFNDYTQIYRDPNNFRIVGGPRPQTLSRPWITDATLAKHYARESGAAMALPFTQGDLTVKREWLDINHVLPGMVFTYNSGFYGLSFLLRLLEVEYAADSGAKAVMTVEWERSKWPSIYIPQPFQGPGGFTIGPRAIWQQRITEVPYLLLDQKFDTQLICLAVRGNVEVQGYRIWLSMDDGATYQLVPSESSTSSFASFGRLYTQISGAVQLATLHLYGVDLDEVQSQMPEELSDDTLLLFMDGEVMSVGGVHPLGGGKFSVNILRARFGTAAATHVANTNMFFLYRSRLTLIDNAGFIPGTTVKFKLQPFTADLDYDISDPSNAITYNVIGFGDIAPPVLSPSPGVFIDTGPTFVVHVSTPMTGFKALYTLDGTAVSSTSREWPVLTNGSYGQIGLHVTTTIRVRFYHQDSGRSSEQTTGIYTKVNALPPGNTAQCAAPSWTYSGVLMHSAGNLVLTSVTPSSVIHWVKNHSGSFTSGSGGPTQTIALACNLSGDTLEYWATLTGYDDSSHHTIDNTKEITFGGGGHMPPRNFQ